MNAAKHGSAGKKADPSFASRRFRLQERSLLRTPAAAQVVDLRSQAAPRSILPVFIKSENYPLQRCLTIQTTQRRPHGRN